MYPYAVNGWTSQALQVSRDYRELEKKYGALTSMMSSHNQFIARLEKKCQCRDSAQSPQVGAKNPNLTSASLYKIYKKRTQNIFLDCFIFFVWTGCYWTTQKPVKCASELQFWNQPNDQWCSTGPKCSPIRASSNRGRSFPSPHYNQQSYRPFLLQLSCHKKSR